MTYLTSAGNLSARATGLMKNTERSTRMSDTFAALTVYDYFKQFFEQNLGRIYRYWVYRRMFTPYEQKQAYMDESFFEQSRALFGVVREVVPLPNGDLLLGIADIAEDASELSADNRQMTDQRLSDLQLMYMPLDAQELDPNGLLSES